MTAQPPGDSDFIAFPRAIESSAARPNEGNARPPAVSVASLALALTAVGYLALTVLEARSTALLGGTLNFFGVKEVLLSAALTAGFGLAFIRVRGGHATARVLTAVLSGVAMWRGLGFVLDMLTALVGGRLDYWQLTQYLKGGVLLLCGLAALLAVLRLSNRTARWFVRGG